MSGSESLCAHFCVMSIRQGPRREQCWATGRLRSPFGWAERLDESVLPGSRVGMEARIAAHLAPVVLRPGDVSRLDELCLFGVRHRLDGW